MTNRTPLDYDSIMSPSIHEPSTKPVPGAEREAFEALLMDALVASYKAGLDSDSKAAGRLEADAVRKFGHALIEKASARLSPAIPVEALDSAIDLMQREADACDSQAKMFDNPDVARSYYQLAINYREGAASLHKLLESAK